MIHYYLRKIPATVLLVCLMTTLFSSCEKDENISQSDGLSFCPLKFRYYLQGSPQYDNCGIIFSPDYDPVFNTTFDGVQVKVPLKKFSGPFISADTTPQVFPANYVALHRTNAQSKFQVDFDKISMFEGTRISLFFEEAIPSLTGFPEFVMKAFDPMVDIGAASKHKWQIFVQRENNGKYTLGYIANGQESIVKSDMADFTSASVQLENLEGKAILKGSLKGGTPLADIATFDTTNDNLPAIPDNYYSGFGFNIIESLQDDCTTRPVEVKLKKYLYKSSNAAQNYEDNFTCNTIYQK